MATHLEAPNVSESWAAAQTIARFFQHLDDGQPELAASLFTIDGAWTRLGERLVGRDQVLRALKARPQALVTRHLVTNVVTEADVSGIRARYYVTVFDYQGSDAVPAPLQLPFQIIVCEDTLVETPRGWLFAERIPRVAFKRHS